MNVIALILGVLALAYVGECQIVWTSPTTVPSTGGDAGEVVYLNEGATTIFTVSVTASTAMTIKSQTPASALSLAFTTPDGVLTLASGYNIDYQTAPIHVLVIEAVAATTESATITIVANQLMYAQPNQCITWRGAALAAGTIGNSFATGATTIVHASISATTGYTYDIANGNIKTTSALTAGTTAVAVTVVATAAEAHGTPYTATTTVVVCINGGCSCTSYGFSGSSALAAGLLSVIMVLVMQLK